MSGIAVAASLHARKIARTIASVKTSQIAAASDSYLALEGTVKAVNGRTLPREKFLEVNRGGSKAALFVAALPMGLAVTFSGFASDKNGH